MRSGRDVSERRLTGVEESELVALTHRMSVAQAEVDNLTVARDRIVADIVAGGVPVSDVAAVLGVAPAAIHAMIERARQR